MKNYLIFPPTQYFLSQDLSGERDFNLWDILSLELVMCIKAKCCSLRSYRFEPWQPRLEEAYRLGETCLLAPTFKSVAHRACLELLPGVVGSRVLTRNQYLGSAFSEIKLLTKWNQDCAKPKLEPAEQLVWVETTNLSQHGVPRSFRVRATLRLLEHFQCLGLAGP